ncbi:unnamed protein product [Orchesella dallaii]|uniref:Annexin n=1 Tax=Orchesella dallaii TaxID=48710 RepID=A0ABP1RPW9_9HEXA
MFPNQYPNPQQPGYPPQGAPGFSAPPVYPPGGAGMYPPAAGYPAAGFTTAHPQAPMGYGAAPPCMLPAGYPTAAALQQAPAGYGVVSSGYPAGHPGQPVQGAQPLNASALSESLLGYKQIPSIKAEKFDAQTDAQILRKAMKGIGTDEAAIINVLTKRTNKQRIEIVTAFKGSYGKDLIKDLKSELSGRLEKVAIALVTPRNEYLAQRLYKAMEGLGTKESTLIDILCTSSNAEIKAIKDTYQKLYKKPLESDISGDTSGHFCRLLTSLLTATRDETPVGDPSKATQDAEALYRAGEKKVGTDESTFNMILTGRSWPQIRLILDAYTKVSHGNTLEKAIKSEFSGDITAGLLAIVKVARNKAAYFAERLHDSVAGMGTNDSDLIFICVTRAEVDMENIKKEYLKMYHKTVAQAISGDTSGDYKKILLGLVGH